MRRSSDKTPGLKTGIDPAVRRADPLRAMWVSALRY
jgi:hypothetical protein